MWVEPADFRTAVHATPLVSIDLVVTNRQGEVLLGKRMNRPARDSWFVPGGRIRKNEPLDQAFERLAQDELNLRMARSQSAFLGVFEHFYEDSVFGSGNEHPSTHYVALAHAIALPSGTGQTWPLNQHTQFRWWPVAEALHSSAVHAYTKAYLNTYSEREQ